MLSCSSAGRGYRTPRAHASALPKWATCAWGLEAGPETARVLFEICVEVLGAIYERFVGRPRQRQRADRLITEGRVRSILFDADDGVLPVPCLDGVADVSEKRIQMWGTELWVHDIEGDPDEGPIYPFADGTYRPSDGNLAFRPRTASFTLRLHNCSRVCLTVLQHLADEPSPSTASQIGPTPKREPIRNSGAHFPLVKPPLIGSCVYLSAAGIGTLQCCHGGESYQALGLPCEHAQTDSVGGGGDRSCRALADGLHVSRRRADHLSERCVPAAAVGRQC